MGKPLALTLKWESVAGKCAACGHTILNGKAGDIGECCRRHTGKLRKFYKAVPKGADIVNDYVKVSTLCRKAESAGLSAGDVVNRTGGDGGTNPPDSEVWQIYTLPKGATKVQKFCARAADKALDELIASVKAERTK